MKISHRLNKVVGVLLIVRVFVPPVAIILLGWAAVDIYLSVSAEIDKAISDLKSSLQPISDAFGAIKDAIDWTGVDFPSFNPIKVSNLITNPLAKFKTKVEQWFWVLGSISVVVLVYLVLNYLAQCYEQVQRGMDLIRSGSPRRSRRSPSSQGRRRSPKAIRMFKTVSSRVSRYFKKAFHQPARRGASRSAAIAPPTKKRRR